MISGRDFRALIELHTPFNRFELWTDNFLEWKAEILSTGLVTDQDIFPNFTIFGTFKKLFTK